MRNHPILMEEEAHEASRASNQKLHGSSRSPGADGAPAASTVVAGPEKALRAASAVPSYSKMLKTNIRFDQRLKRNVLE